MDPNAAVYDQATRPHRGMDIIVATAVFLGLAVTLPWLLLSQLAHGLHHVSELWAFFGAIVYGAFRISVAFSARRQNILSAAFGIFVYINLGLAALVQYGAGTFPWPGMYSSDTVLMANGLVVAGCLSFELGRFLSRYIAPKKFAWHFALDPNRVTLVGLASLATIPVLFFATGWDHLIFKSRLESLQVAADASGSMQTTELLLWLLRAIPLVLFVAIGLYWAARRRGLIFERARIPFYRTAFFFFLVLASLLANPLSTPRLWQGTVGLAFIVVACEFFQLRTQRWASLFLMVAYLFIFPLADMFRYELTADSSAAESKKGGMAAKMIEDFKSGNFDSFQQILNAQDYVKWHGMRKGRQLASAIFFFVPRSIWASKAVHSGVLLAQGMGYSFTNLACPLFAEGYLDFGVAGSVGFLVLLGFGLGIVEYKITDQPNIFSTCHLFAAIFAGYEIFFVRGALVGSVAYFAPVLLLLVLMQKPERAGTAS